MANIDVCKLSDHAALPMQGIHLFEETLCLRHILSTGCKSSDQLLDGGLFTQELTEIFGPPGVGKTQFALTAVSNVVSQTAHNVVYLDTTGSFNVERLVQIIHSTTVEFSQQALKKQLSKVHCYRVFDIFEALSRLDRLMQTLLLEHDTFALNLKFLVLDSINSLVTPILGGKKQEGHALMCVLGQRLKQMAFQFGICVLVLNAAVGVYDKNPSDMDALKPTLGRTWMHVPNVRLFLNFNKNKRHDEERYLELIKHPRVKRNCRTVLYIVRSGVASECDE